MNRLYFDIETVKTQRADYPERVAQTIKPDGRISKPETLAKWEVEDKPKAIEKVIEQSVFNGGLCHVVQIQFALNENDPTVHMITDVSKEKEMIGKFFEYIDGCGNETQMIGHNVKAFDLLVLKQRAIVLGIKIPPVLLSALNQKYNNDFCYDTMTEWGGYKDMVSMDNLCYYLSLPTPKGEVNGATFGKLWEEGTNGEMLYHYGYEEIEALRLVYKRMIGELI